jgi:hypothetical protein
MPDMQAVNIQYRKTICCLVTVDSLLIKQISFYNGNAGLAASGNFSFMFFFIVTVITNSMRPTKSREQESF